MMNSEVLAGGGAGPVVIRVNEAAGQEAIDRARALLDGIPGGVDKAVKAAMSRAVQKVRSGSNRAIREKYDISDAGIRSEKNVQVRYDYQSGVQATITFSGRKIPLYRFGGSYPAVPTFQTDRWIKAMSKGEMTWFHPGVRAGGHQFKDTNPVPLSHPKRGTEAFVARMQSGHVGIFARTEGRTSENSDEIEELMGSSVAQMISRPEVAQRLTEEAYRTFETELDGAVYRILTGWR